MTAYKLQQSTLQTLQTGHVLVSNEVIASLVVPSPIVVVTKFVTCGSTAEEAIKGHKELMEEWEKFLEKEAKGPYHDRRKLK